MDPLSISAGAAGFISLGLTTAGGIIKYCKSYRSRDADFTQLMHHAKELESFLSSIQNRTTTQQTPNGDIDSSLQGCRNACDACLGDFKNLNAKYANVRPLQRLTYPFNKTRLDDLRSRLQEFHARLLGLLQLINLDATRDIRSITISESARITRTIESVGRDVQSSLSDARQVVTSTMHTSINQLELSFQRGLGETETHLMSSMDDNHRALSDQVSLITVDQENHLSSFRQYMDHRLSALEKNQQEFFTRALSASARVHSPQDFLNSSTADQRWVRRSVREKINLGMSERSIFDSLWASIQSDVFKALEYHINTDKRAEEIMHIVVESFARQRKELLQMAIRYLPTETIEELELQNEGLLDHKASIVVDALRQQQIPIPTAYKFLKRRSVYHWSGLTARTAQMLFEVGFCKINSTWRGYTTLVVQIEFTKNPEVLLDLASWFKDHGGDFHSRIHVHINNSRFDDITNSNITSYINSPRPPLTIHFLMFRLGELTLPFEPNSFFHPLLPSLFGDEIADSCACYCTARGCTPTSKYLSYILLYTRSYASHRYFTKHVLGAIRWVEPRIPANHKYNVSLEYIRLVAHWYLEMRHTCCRFGTYYRREGCLVGFLEKSEIEEILEEERYLAQQLDTLVAEFEKRFQELNLSLSEFMENYISPRFEEIRKERHKWSAGELQAIHETGVVLDDDDDDA
ncbi:hypothetical protein Daesc_007879 [Daldinia eschscholtzii]|uniref:Azaphilone pigments biosynthesis cluster protein L N-terminal domain-containing protein n=1 Tax=Daldinia eschscholtzii TaxID=292717 RepID=A0AAX6MFF5_9PEZI